MSDDEHNPSDHTPNHTTPHHQNGDTTSTTLTPLSPSEQDPIITYDPDKKPDKGILKKPGESNNHEKKHVPVTVDATTEFKEHNSEKYLNHKIEGKSGLVHRRKSGMFIPRPPPDEEEDEDEDDEEDGKERKSGEVNSVKVKEGEGEDKDEAAKKEEDKKKSKGFSLSHKTQKSKEEKEKKKRR